MRNTLRHTAAPAVAGCVLTICSTAVSLIASWKVRVPSSFRRLDFCSFWHRDSMADSTRLVTAAGRGCSPAGPSRDRGAGTTCSGACHAAGRSGWAAGCPWGYTSAADVGPGIKTTASPRLSCPSRGNTVWSPARRDEQPPSLYVDGAETAYVARAPCPGCGASSTNASAPEGAHRDVADGGQLTNCPNVPPAAATRSAVNLRQ